jgi:cytochrome c553
VKSETRGLPIALVTKSWRKPDASGLSALVKGHFTEENAAAPIFPEVVPTPVGAQPMRHSTVLTCLALCSLADCHVRADNNSPDTGTIPDPYVTTADPYGETVKKVEFLEQNWNPSERNRFYYTAQGSQLIPYGWFLHLEQADSEKLFRDDQNILKYRYLPQGPGLLNPDGLPVGFVGGEGAGGRRWLGFTCAACHTNEIHLGDTAYRADGAPTLADAQAFLVDLVGALKQTLAVADKFQRFAKNVLATNTPEKQDELKGELQKSIQIRAGYNLRNFLDFDPKLTAPQAPTRYGRLDAVDSIVNEAFWATVKNQDLNNPTVVARQGNALVSYPFLWDTPQHDKVEWLGIATNGKVGESIVGLIGEFNGLPRNVGEVLGVFGDFEISDPPSVLSGGYHSSVMISNLKGLEELVRTLWSPAWPAAFPKIDSAAALEGEKLYRKRSTETINDSCLDCHAVINRKTFDRSRISIVANLSQTKTDPQAFFNFFKPTRPSGKLAGAFANLISDPKIQANSVANPVLSNVVIGVILGSWKSAPPDKLKEVEFGRRSALMLDDEANNSVYKGRPLDGIWATAPYLHNGSVPTLDDLLKPAVERPKSFSVGTRVYDPLKVGFQTAAKGFPKFEVLDKDGKAIAGHSNGGHEYGATLNPVERSQLLEYLKSL